MVVHFSGFKMRGHPGVLLVSPLSVCLDCGHAAFTISKPNLDLLQVGLESDEETGEFRYDAAGMR